ncbi:homeodomain-only protein-like isoform X3 [Neodiprion lecontei]|uniref:Homeodomain-only protein n=1 Tax=Neodiprion lecontei TaxID=441921 RepID=A0ABM3FQW8_NEOLC|nr:homeodomain-only protein-like isoform X3 [Neodiprion lecontei]
MNDGIPMIRYLRFVETSVRCFPESVTSSTKRGREGIQQKMLKSVSPRLSPRGGAEPRIIRLTTDQEAVLQEQFNRCPRAPHTADIVLLAAETGLSEADVQGWYAIRLAQWRKEQGLGGNLHFSN